ncbi:MAG: hypothetical protein AAF299_17830 [Pseudomonadota bacterium]
MGKVNSFLPQYAIGVVKALITLGIGLAALSMFPPIIVLMLLPFFRELLFLGTFVLLAALVRFNVIQWLGAITPFVVILAGVGVEKYIKHKAALAISSDHKIERTIGKIDVLAVSRASSMGYVVMPHALAYGLADSVLILTRYEGVARAGNLPPSGRHWESRKYELVDSEKCTFTYKNRSDYEPVRYGNDRLNSQGIFDKCIALTETKTARDVWSLFSDGILIRREKDDKKFPGKVFNDPDAGMFLGLVAQQVVGGRSTKELARWEYVQSYNPPREYGRNPDPKKFLEALTGLTADTARALSKRTTEDACLYQLELLNTISIYPDGSVGYIRKSSNERWYKYVSYKKPRTDRIKVDDKTLAACSRLRDAVCSQSQVPDDEAKQRCLGLYNKLFSNWLSGFPQ